MEIDQEEIRMEYDQDINEEEVNKIKEEMATRNTPKNQSLIYAILMNGGCTKGFASRNELARHIYGKFGSRWDKNIRTINQSGEMKTNTKPIRKIFALNLDGNAHFIGEIHMGKEIYAVYDCPADGSCFYHSFAHMVRPIFEGKTSSAVALRESTDPSIDTRKDE